MTAKSLPVEGGALATPKPDASGLRAYKGIPYAGPPLRPLRWRPQQPVMAWDGVREVSAFGPNYADLAPARLASSYRVNFVPEWRGLSALALPS